VGDGSLKKKLRDLEEAGQSDTERNDLQNNQSVKENDTTNVAVYKTVTDIINRKKNIFKKTLAEI
jgi:hypothetical protein